MATHLRVAQVAVGCISSLRIKTRAQVAVLIGSLVVPFQVLAQAPMDTWIHRLGPGDRVTVVVFGQPELSGDIYVDGSGNIHLPFAGEINVGDLTIPECQNRISDQLANGLNQRRDVLEIFAEVLPLLVLMHCHCQRARVFRHIHLAVRIASSR